MKKERTLTKKEIEEMDKISLGDVYFIIFTLFGMLYFIAIIIKYTFFRG